MIATGGVVRVSAMAIWWAIAASSGALALPAGAEAPRAACDGDSVRACAGAAESPPAEPRFRPLLLAQAPTSTPRPWLGKDCPQCPDMVSIPLGSFTMGAPPGEEEREKLPQQFQGRASPRRAVTISQRFSLGRYEVTRAQYSAFAAATGRASDLSCYAYGTDGKWVDQPGLSWLNPGFPQSDSDPVVCVSWNDAMAYVEWLSRTTGKTYRLPSETEWEYAARAGTGTARHWGDGRNEACRFANVADLTAAQKLNWKNDPDNVFQCSDNFTWTAPVGRFQPNGFGLYDMLGNVWEWVEDCWNDNYQGASSGQEARRGGNCGLRVARGGGWGSVPRNVRAANRSRDPAGNRNSSLGFRVARTD